MQTVLIIAYPLLTHLAIILNIPKLQASAIFILATGLLYNSLKAGHKIAWLILIGISLLAVASIWFQLANYALYVPPILLPLLFLGVFGQTLLPGQVPLVTAIGEESRGPLSAAMKNYTRNVTIMWTLIFLGMVISSMLLLWLASPELWSLFTNIINYIAVGAVFAGEYIYRRLRFKDHDHPSFIDYLRIVVRANIRKV
jgi:uncharacterized membrane protein